MACTRHAGCRGVTSGCREGAGCRPGPSIAAHRGTAAVPAGRARWVRPPSKAAPLQGSLPLCASLRHALDEGIQRVNVPAARSVSHCVKGQHEGTRAGIQCGSRAGHRGAATNCRCTPARFAGAAGPGGPAHLWAPAELLLLFPAPASQTTRRASLSCHGTAVIARVEPVGQSTPAGRPRPRHFSDPSFPPPPADRCAAGQKQCSAASLRP